MQNIQHVTCDECIHQSGEAVTECGHYELVGATVEKDHPLYNTTYLVLHRGEIFPNFNGWSVSWHCTSILEVHDCLAVHAVHDDAHTTPWQ